MSEELRELICSIIKVLELIAKKTANPVDDMVVKGLKAIFGC